MKIVKNKVAAPFKTCEFDIMYNEGISVAGDLIDLGVEHLALLRKWQFLYFRRFEIRRRPRNCQKLIKEDKKLMAEIRKAILAEVKSKEIEASGSKK